MNLTKRMRQRSGQAEVVGLITEVESLAKRNIAYREALRRIYDATGSETGTFSGALLAVRYIAADALVDWKYGDRLAALLEEDRLDREQP